MFSEAHVSYGPQADVEEGDDAHAQIENLGEPLRPVHLVLQWQNLQRETVSGTFL